ncbi:hypothetical protein [Microbacterium sp. cf332]|uniref:hypothetical protein n=1 Tax=Microbacterium sp. cf332 TaxID=1761804 RepID=UPI0008812AFC|nr:hypothetical protein [Microbacterium sp. cf332]SDQ27571.1 hypothetical protein SAMN04487847_1196 [Microbacterium sp. cf332]
MSNGNVPFVAPGALPVDPVDEAPTLEVDGQDVLDEDVDDDQVSSIDADHAATQSDEA